MIFYFSGTGNTLWAAQTLAERLGDRLVNMADAIGGEGRYTLGEHEAVGFIFPVHGWRTPRLVRQFIDQLSIDAGGKSHYAYLILTAGDSIGRTVERLLPHLRAKGIDPQLFASIIMPESYVGLPFMDVDTPAKEQKKKDEAARQLDALVETIARWDCRRRDDSFARSHAVRSQGSSPVPWGASLSVSSSPTSPFMSLPIAASSADVVPASVP